MIWMLCAAVAAPSPEISSETLMLLSLRHPPTCAQVVETTTEPVAELLHIAQTVTRPPMAPMRAAHCVMALRDDDARVVSSMRQWVARPEWKGLGRLVLSRIDAYDLDLAVDLVTRAYRAKHDLAYLTNRLEDDSRPEVRAVLREDVTPLP